MNLLSLIGLAPKSNSALPAKQTLQDAATAEDGAMFRNMVGQKCADNLSAPAAASADLQPSGAFKNGECPAKGTITPAALFGGAEAAIAEAVELLAAGAALLAAQQEVPTAGEMAESSIGTEDAAPSALPGMPVANAGGDLPVVAGVASSGNVVIQWQPPVSEVGITMPVPKQGREGRVAMSGGKESSADVSIAPKGFAMSSELQASSAPVVPSLSAAAPATAAAAVQNPVMLSPVLPETSQNVAAGVIDSGQNGQSQPEQPQQPELPLSSAPIVPAATPAAETLINQSTAANLKPILEQPQMARQAEVVGSADSSQKAAAAADAPAQAFRSPVSNFAAADMPKNAPAEQPTPSVQSPQIADAIIARVGRVENLTDNQFTDLTPDVSVNAAQLQSDGARFFDYENIVPAAPQPPAGKENPAVVADSQTVASVAGELTAAELNGKGADTAHKPVSARAPTLPNQPPKIEASEENAEFAGLRRTTMLTPETTASATETTETSTMKLAQSPAMPAPAGEQRVAFDGILGRGRVLAPAEKNAPDIMPQNASAAAAFRPPAASAVAASSASPTGATELSPNMAKENFAVAVRNLRHDEPAGGEQGLAQSLPISSNAAAAAAMAERGRGINTVVERIEQLQELVEKLDQHVLQTLQGAEKSMLIRLMPPNLGRVQLNCQADDSQVRVALVVENGAVQQILQQQENALRNILQQAGYRLEQFDVRTQNEETGARSHRQRASDARKNARAVDAAAGIKQTTEVKTPQSAAVGYRYHTGGRGVWFVA